MELFLPALIVGLVTSVHCVAMCGCLVLTYAVKDDTEGPWLRRMLPHFAYQSAKILSYVTVGVLLGSIGLLLGLDESLGGFRGYFTVFASALMVLIGLQMTGWFPVLNKLTFRPPRWLMNALSKTRKRARDDEATGHSSLVTPVSFGLLTGLMPCAPLMAQQAAAAASGSPVSGAVIMLGFGLGTAPLMLGFGAVSGMLSQRVKTAMNVVAAVVIIGFGLVLLNRGLMLTGSPVTALTVQRAVLGAPATPGEPAADVRFATAADGVAEIPLVIENTRFVPETVQIPADRPVRLVVDRREANACSDQLAVPQLGVLANLAPNGTTIVDLPAAKGGSYTLTCGMGMMSGSLVVGGAAAASAGSGLMLPILGIAAVGVGGLAWWASRGRRTPVPEAACPLPEEGAAASSAIFGLSPTEILLGAAAIAVAVVAGLAFGGALR